MSLNVKVSGAWKPVAAVSTKVSGAWKTVSNIWVKVAGVWEQVYANLVASFPASYYDDTAVWTGGSPVTAQVTITPTITGVGPYTYFWEWTGSPTSASSSSGSTMTFQLTDSADANEFGEVWLTVTDAYGNSVTTENATWNLIISSIL